MLYIVVDGSPPLSVRRASVVSVQGASHRQQGGVRKLPVEYMLSGRNYQLQHSNFLYYSTGVNIVQVPCCHESTLDDTFFRAEK